MPPDEPQEDELALALGRQIGLLKAGLAAEHKEDWIALALSEVCSLPAGLVLEALPDIRKRVRYEGDVVPAVLEAVEPTMQRLQAELRCLEKLEAVVA